MSHSILLSTTPGKALISLKKTFLICHAGSTIPSRMYKQFLAYENAWIQGVVLKWAPMKVILDPNALRNSLKNHTPEGSPGRVAIFKSFQAML